MKFGHHLHASIELFLSYLTIRYWHSHADPSRVESGTRNITWNFQLIRQRIHSSQITLHHISKTLIFVLVISAHDSFSGSLMWRKSSRNFVEAKTIFYASNRFVLLSPQSIMIKLIREIIWLIFFIDKWLFSANFSMELERLAERKTRLIKWLKVN